MLEPAVSEIETIITLEDVCRQARTADPATRARLVRDVAMLVDATPQAWWQSARLCTAAASAYGELGQFEAAIRYYEMVTARDKADAPIEAIEQLANLRARWATELAQSDPTKLPQALDHLRRAQRLLKALVDVGETHERYSMLGSLEKRRAMLTTGDERRRALADMGAAYAAASGMARTLGPSAIAYSLSNVLAAKVVLLWALPDGSPERAIARPAVDEAMATLKDAATQLDDSSTDFFDLSAKGTWILLHALATATLSETARHEVVEAYRRAASRGATPRVLASMQDQIAFFEDMARTEVLAADRRDALVASLAQLRAVLRA
jgi:tetratricopeptide (TPR) repeat protein